MAANHLLRRTKTGGGPKNDLQIQRAGRKSRKSTTVFVGIKPYGKCQLNTEQVRLLMSGLLLAAVIVITAVILSNHLSVRQP